MDCFGNLSNAMLPVEVYARSMPLDPSDMPQVPKTRTIKVGDHTQEQAETLLSEPIMIPRNPVSMNVRMIVVVLFADIVFAAVFVLLIGGMALDGMTVGMGTAVALIVLLAIRFTILMLVLAKMASNWAEVGYYMTDRAIIVRRGLANITENTYELGNIRHVYMLRLHVPGFHGPTVRLRPCPACNRHHGPGGKGPSHRPQKPGSLQDVVRKIPWLR